MGVANFTAAFASSYVVSGGLSQSTVNEKSGAKTPLSLIICSITLGVILLYLTSLLENLPEVILAVIVLHAVAGLIKVKELKRIYELNRYEFVVAMIAIAGVLVFGILKGVMLAVLMSLILLIMRMTQPTVATLGRIANTPNYSDIERHPDNVVFDNILVLRIESSILYFNADYILEKINIKLKSNGQTRLVILDLSSASYVDVAGSNMLLQLSNQLNTKDIQRWLKKAIKIQWDYKNIVKRKGKLIRL